MSVTTTIGRDVLNLPYRYEGAGGGLEQAAYISGHQDALLAAYGVIRDSPALAKLEASHESLLAAANKAIAALAMPSLGTQDGALAALAEAVAAAEGE